MGDCVVSRGHANGRWQCNMGIGACIGGVRYATNGEDARGRVGAGKRDGTWSSEPVRGEVESWKVRWSLMWEWTICESVVVWGLSEDGFQEHRVGAVEVMWKSEVWVVESTRGSGSKLKRVRWSWERWKELEDMGM